MRRREHQAGLTLVELMVVVAIIGILSATIGATMGRTDNRGAVELFSQRLLISLRQARNTAVDTNARIRVELEANGQDFTVSRQDPTDPNVWLALTEERGSGSAVVHAVLSGAQRATISSPSSTLPQTIQFQPDGSATVGTLDGATVYLRDASGTHQMRVVVFGLTGYSHLVTRW